MEHPQAPQSGPGLKPPTTPKTESAPAPGMGPNGQSQSESRGKDGKSV